MRFSALIGALIGILLAWIYRFPPIDDAFITFRYAEHLATGAGMVYNPGEWVLGTTSPLWCLILAALKFVGLPCELSALIISALSAAALIHVASGILPRLSPLVTMLFSAAVIQIPSIQASIFSGMETLPYIFVLVCSLITIGQDRPWLSAAFAALAFGFRPDGGLLLGVAFLNWIRRPALFLKFSSVFVPFVATVIFLIWQIYGLPVPHSVLAKKVLYATEWWRVLFMFFEAHSQTPIDAIALCLSGAGLVAAASLPLLRVWAVWFVLYMIGMSFGQVKPIFYWYFSPSWFVLVWGGLSAGVVWLQRNRPELKVGAVLGILSIVMIVSSVVRMQDPGPQVAREMIYRQIVSDFKGEIDPGSSLLLEEIGILGSGFSKSVIIDAAGLVSPLVLEVLQRERSERRFGEIFLSSATAREVIERSKPDWIVGPPGRLRGAEYEREGWFQERYQLVREYPTDGGVGIAVFRVRQSGPLP